MIRETNAYLRYRTGGNSFVAPPLVATGSPYGGILGSLEVYVDATPLDPSKWTYSSDTGLVTTTDTYTVDNLVEIRRVTPLESLVTFPVPDRYSPLHNNKSIAQWLALIQELWGMLKWLYWWGRDQMEILYDYIDAEILALKIYLMNYINTVIAGAFSITGITGATVSLDVSATQTVIPTPHKFTQGVLMLGGSMYNLSDPSHATLDNSGAYTQIVLSAPLGFDTKGVLMIFGTDPEHVISWAGLRATTHTDTWAAGVSTMLVPFVFTKGMLLLGGETYVLPSIVPAVTLTDVGGAATLITLPVAPTVDHTAIVVMFTA